MEETIVKYLSEESSEVENQDLLRWVNASEENRKYFTSVCNIWNNTNTNKHSYSAENAHKQFVVAKSVQGKNQFNKKYSLRKNKYKSIALAISGVAASLLIGLLFVFNQNQEVENIIVHNDSDISKTVILPDSSIVTLNKLATIEYKSNFEGKTRSLSLQGEAFFEIAKGMKEFEVLTENTVTKVLGTSFNINTEGINGNTNIYVNSGKVQFEAKGKALRLEAGDLAEFNASTTDLIKK